MSPILQLKNLLLFTLPFFSIHIEMIPFGDIWMKNEQTLTSQMKKLFGKTEYIYVGV